MNANLLLVADYANTTADNRLNVMGIFTQVYSVNFPAVHPQMYLIAQLSANPAEYGRKFKLGIKLLDADATKELINFISEVEVPKPDNGQPVLMNFVIPLISVVFEKQEAINFHCWSMKMKRRLTPLM